MATVVGYERKEEKGTKAYLTASLPGFQFNPTDEQLVFHYLRLKNEGRESEVQTIGEVDFYDHEPWDLPDLSVIKSNQRESFFFCRCRPDAKVSSRRNRATPAGYWKSTGKDRSIQSSRPSCDDLIGTKKTLVFYKGRAPKGTRTDWIMHEYSATKGGFVGTSPHQDDFVLCRLLREGLFDISLKADKIHDDTGSSIITTNSSYTGVSDLASEAVLPGINQYLSKKTDTPSRKGRLGDIKGVKIHRTGSSIITTNSSYTGVSDLASEAVVQDPDGEVLTLSQKTLTETKLFICERCNIEGYERDLNLQHHRGCRKHHQGELPRRTNEVLGDCLKESLPQAFGETLDMDWKTFSMGLEICSDTIIQREVLQSCLMSGGLGLTGPPEDEDWENAKKIYLMDNELSDLPKNPRCPVLSTLFLQRNYKLRTIPPSFFDHMPALQILNLSRTGIKSLPESIIKLVSLERLFLNDCHRFMILSPKVGELEQLEVLDLEGTDIMDLPKEIKELTNLTCLEVSFCAYLSNGRRATQSDVVVPCGIISALSYLEELNMSVNPDDKRWSACVEAIVTEVCTLHRLNTLKFYFPRVELVRHFLLNSPMWVHPSLSNFRFTVGHHVKRTMSRLPHDVEFELERWERCLKYINGVAVPREIKKVLHYSTAFFLERHATVKKLSDFGIGNMKQLKCCVVGECNELKVIIDATDAQEEDSEADAHEEDDEADPHEGDSEADEEDNEADAHEEDDEVEAYREDGSSGIVSKTSGAKKIVLGSLEYLYIYYMKNLRRIWEGPVQPKCLSLLKSMTLCTCPELITIFTTGLLHNLYNLEKLTIEDCPSIKTLVSCEISTEHKTSDFLPSLKRISLHYMPGLVSISNGLHIAPRFEWLSFYNCTNLKHLLIEEVSGKDLKKIKGEWNWWVALKWSSGRPSNLDDIFVPINI